MSVVFVVAPMVVGGWPILCGAVAAAAASLGYKALAVEHTQQAEPIEKRVEIPLEDSEVVVDSMARESEFTIRNNDVTAAFSRSADGRCMVHVAGEDKTEAELNQIGKELIGRVTQQYAYNKVVTELKGQGFTVTGEEVTSDQAIRIRVSKYV